VYELKNREEEEVPIFIYLVPQKRGEVVENYNRRHSGHNYFNRMNNIKGKNFTLFM
jgi:hypothetical protein